MLKSFLGRIRGRISGPDIFIAYSRRDARDYAAELADRLTERGFDCFTDLYGTSPDRALPTSLLKTLRRSSTLVVLATPGAADSYYISREVEEFRRVGRQIILIDFDRSLQGSVWATLVVGLAPTSDSLEALRQGTPSESVVYRIDRAFRFTRRNQRIRRYAFSTAALLVLLVATMIAAMVFVQRRLSEAQRLFAAVSNTQRELEEERARVAELTRQLAEEQARAVLPADSSGHISQLPQVVADLQREAEAQRSKVNELTGQLNEQRAKTTGDEKKTNGIWTTVIVIATFVLLYIGTFVILLNVHPLWILTLYGKFSLENAVEAVDSSSALGKVTKLLIKAVGLDYFAKHEKTRGAWIEHYKEGKGKFGDLPPLIKAEYVKHTDALDAWVYRRRVQAEDALYQMTFLAQRSAFVHLPIIKETPKRKARITDYESSDFGYLFETTNATLIELVGQGGIGKSSFAGQLARWALEENSSRRLTTHLMIPLFVQEDTRSKDAITWINAHLKDMLGDEDTDNLDPDIVKELLRKKRILLLIDGLSEKSDEMQQNVTSIFQAVAANALVITTRKEHDFGTRRVTIFKPEGVTNKTLYYFITEYSNKKSEAADEEEDAKGWLSGEQQHEVNGHVMKVLTKRDGWPTITPLIVKLIIDQAVELRRRNVPLSALPDSAPDAILEYLRMVNPKERGTPNRVPDDVMVAAARILAKACLEPKWAPRIFFRDEGQRALKDAGCEPANADVITRLVQNGVLEESDHGGTSFLRFSFDPVAEYLAAFYWLDRLRSDEAAWKTWVHGLTAAESYPEGMQGFLAAFKDCIDSYSTHFLVPELQFPWVGVVDTEKAHS